jgi:hypothetical protein
MVRNKINHSEVARRLDDVTALLQELLSLVMAETELAQVIVGIDGQIDIIREHMDNRYLVEVGYGEYDVHVYYPKEK